MVSTLDDVKRAAIAAKLADMKAVQNLLIANEQQLISACSDADMRKRLQDMLDDDQKNLGVLDTVMIEYGVKGEPHSYTQNMVEQAQTMMQNSDMPLYTKVAQHELLKHAQVMAGLLVHKCGQVVGADIQAAIAPLNTINFENRAHQEQLKGMIEALGVRELTGRDADQGLWGRVQDAIAAMSGVIGSAVTQTSDMTDLPITQLIRMEHTKARTLFREIENSSDPQRIQEYFGQLYKDLTSHAKAEEEVVYPQVRPYYEKTQNLYDEQAEQSRMLDEIKGMSPSMGEFKDRVRQLRQITDHHINQEESEMFAKITSNFSSEQQQQMATDFKSAKSRLMDQMASSMK